MMGGLSRLMKDWYDSIFDIRHIHCVNRIVEYNQQWNDERSKGDIKQHCSEIEVKR